MSVATETRHVDGYAVSKLAAHPDVLRELRETGASSRLITVHLMPQNTCNHGCSFCSYRMPGNKNASTFDESKAIPWEAMPRLLDDFAALGVQGVEVTGGGEPLAYPWTVALWSEFARRDFATALVTNGTLLGKLAPLVALRLKWARVSIDCATRETYARMRKAPERHFDLAWQAVAELRKWAPRDPEFRLGVGFVLCNENVGEVREFVRMARDHGADNVRLSSTYSDQHLAYFADHDALRRASDESERAAADFDAPGFRVHNLIPSRLWETEHPTQDYDRCPTKDVLCVVEGEGNVFTCCTFTGSRKGRQGNVLTHPRGFAGVWEDAAEFRRGIVARDYCRNACLYRDRNLAMNALIDAPTMPPVQAHVHREFA